MKIQINDRHFKGNSISVPVRQKSSNSKNGAFFEAAEFVSAIKISIFSSIQLKMHNILFKLYISFEMMIILNIRNRSISSSIAKFSSKMWLPKHKIVMMPHFFTLPDGTLCNCVCLIIQIKCVFLPLPLKLLRYAFQVTVALKWYQPLICFAMLYSNFPMCSSESSNTSIWMIYGLARWRYKIECTDYVSFICKHHHFPLCYIFSALNNCPTSV